MAQVSQNLRNPLMTLLKGAASRGDDFAQQADSSNAAQLEVLKKQLDELTDEFRQVSAVTIPLQHQSILFDMDKKTLTRWRDAVEGQFVTERRSLLVKVAALGFAILIVVALAAWTGKSIPSVKMQAVESTIDRNDLAEAFTTSENAGRL